MGFLTNNYEIIVKNEFPKTLIILFIFFTLFNCDKQGFVNN